MECAKQLQDMNVDMKQFIKDGIIPSKAFERPGSQQFIHAAKSGDLETLKRMVAHNKYYVYDFDNIQQTALHWAAKRNYKDIIELLVQNGANVNYTDIVRIFILTMIGWKNCSVSGNKGI